MPSIVDFELPGLKLINPDSRVDDRGEFYESYRKTWFPEVEFVQANHVTSKKNVVRGLHYQAITPTSPGQIKLVRATKGEILDVAVDLRRASPTYGLWTSVILSAENKRQLFIPLGFAHGYRVLTEEAEVQYLCSNFYNHETESGIKWDDPNIGVIWSVGHNSHLQLIVSQRDKENESFAEFHVGTKRTI